MTAMIRIQQAGICFGAALVLAAPVSAQLASPSAAALGMGENFTAVARGYSTLAWNPAGLALSGGPQTSATLGTARAITGIGPITLADLAAVQGEVVSEAVRRQWLAAVTADGGQSGGAGFDMTWAAIQFGHVALQFATVGRALSNISPGLAELLLIGNADADGNARAFDIGGSSMAMQLYSTAAAGFGVPVSVGAASRLALGVAAKYTFGHSLALSGESTGQVTANPITVQTTFPIAYTPFVGDDGVNQYQSGGGVSVDIGIGLETGPWTVSAVAQNVVSTFAWDRDVVRYRATELRAQQGSLESSFSGQPLSAAPPGLLQAVEEHTFQPNLALGAMFSPSPQLRLAADARFGSTDGMASRPPVHVGAGVEYYLLSWLPVQLGAALVRLDDEREGLQFAGGLALELGSFQLAASGGRRNTGMGGENMLMVKLLSHTF
jgi:hypothetical protein